MKSTRWLYLPVEIRVREFDARLLIACCAVERGFSAVIGMKNAVTSHYPVMPRGIVFDRSLSLFREADFLNIRKMGYRICSNDEETFGFYITPESVLRQRVSDKNLMLTDYYFAWGNEQARLMNSAYPGHEDKIKVVGTSRNDLNLEKFHRVMWGEKIRALKRRYGDFILFPTNFSEVQNTLGGRKFTIDQMYEQGAITTDGERVFFEDYLDHKERNLEAFKTTLPKIKAAFPNYQLVVRPHPGEDDQHWRSFLSSYPDIEVVHDGPVTPWLIAATAVFHHGCSTGLESFFLGTPSIAYHPIFDSSHDVHLSTRVGPIARNADDLLRMLNLAVSGQELPREGVEWLENYMVSPNEKRLIADDIVDFFDSIPIAAESESNLKYVKEKLVMAVNKRRIACSRWLKRIVGRPVSPSRHTKRWGYMDASDVADIISKFTKITGRFDGVKVDKLYGQLFKIYR